MQAPKVQPERTPEAHVQTVLQLCIELRAHPSVKDAWLNDYGRYSNFDVWVERKWRKQYRAAERIIRDFCRKNKMIVRNFHRPHPKDHHQSLQVDIDFRSYDPGSNTFDGQ